MSMSKRSRSISDLPREIIWNIVAQLANFGNLGTISALAQTDWHFFGLVSCELYRHDVYRSALLWAARHDQSATVKRSLAQNDSEGFPLPESLVASSAAGHKMVVEAILGGCTDSEISDCTRAAALIAASQSGREEIIGLLLEFGPEWNVQAVTDEKGRTALSWAAGNGHVDTVSLLLKYNFSLSTDREGRTPLAWASQHGHESVIRLLLEQNADVNSKDQAGQTPLIMAVQSKHEGVVRLFLELGTVELDWKHPEGGYSALSYASAAGYVTIAQMLLESGADPENGDPASGQTPLIRASLGGHEDMVKLLLMVGKVNVDATDAADRTALSWAAQYGHEAAVKVLIENGMASVHTPDSRGRTPLSWAAQTGMIHVMTLLIMHGTEVDREDTSGRTELSWAAQSWSTDALELLLDGGHRGVNAVDSSGRSPLSRAAQSGCALMVKLLLENSADPTGKDNSGRTALSWATESWFPDVYEALFEADPDTLDTPDHFKQSPLSWAAQSGNSAAVRFLLRNGAERTVRDDFGQTPLSWAQTRGHQSVVRLLQDET